ncbi:hypothetical protein N657DRAFT_646621 [Parathielavia appendiculata]|uniref:Uncharacterized protein n=1 Tax=Parathielavia appendiculata TaxID=2587402 RepID=A0AAN6TY62_9PEZI|nr:hypothetical protein N657DRAFT_646621 [Parathielavia appendiculata]
MANSGVLCYYHKRYFIRYMQEIAWFFYALAYISHNLIGPGGGAITDPGGALIVCFTIATLVPALLLRLWRMMGLLLHGLRR